MTKRKQPKTATYEGIHTCSKGCKKPGCSRGLRDEIESLKAELERLKKTDPESVTDIDIQADPAWAIGVFRFHRQNDWAEIERLRKAGDVIADWLDEQGNYGGLTDAWRAANKPTV